MAHRVEFDFQKWNNELAPHALVASITVKSAGFGKTEDINWKSFEETILRFSRLPTVILEQCGGKDPHKWDVIDALSHKEVLQGVRALGKLELRYSYWGPWSRRFLYERCTCPQKHLCPWLTPDESSAQ